VVGLGSVAFGTLSTPSATGVTTTVTIERGFKGLVMASSPCQNNRSVTVMRSRRGPDKVVGSDSSNSTGFWELPSKRRTGRYYAVASATTIPGAGYGYGYGYGYSSTTCDKGKSGKISLGHRHHRRR
jgi:hypothetical protein